MPITPTHRADGANNDYFETMFEWTRRKHDILEQYTDTFTRIKGGLYCVDGFAGRGLHRDGQQGSPLITAALAQRFREQGKSYWLKCINVEKDPQYYEDLNQFTTHAFPALIQNGWVRNLCGEFAGHQARIFQLIQGYPTIFFLDPFGVDGIEWTALEPILHRSAITELLINFNVRYVPRLAGHLTSEAAAAPAKVRRLTKTLGTDRWKASVQPSASDEAIVEQLATDGPLAERITAIYRDQLRQGFPYVYDYPIRAVADGHVRYTLVFATRNPKGVLVMNDILCNIEARYQAEFEQAHPTPPSPSATQLALFDAPGEAQPQRGADSHDPVPASQLIRELTEAVITTLREAPARSLTYEQLRFHLADRFFARVKKTTYSPVLRDLQTEGRLTWEGAPRRLPAEDAALEWRE